MCGEQLHCGCKNPAAIASDSSGTPSADASCAVPEQYTSSTSTRPIHGAHLRHAIPDGGTSTVWIPALSRALPSPAIRARTFAVRSAMRA